MTISTGWEKINKNKKQGKTLSVKMNDGVKIHD